MDDASVVSWLNLQGVLGNPELESELELLEGRYHVTDEAEVFSSLVNMSMSCRQPFHRWIRYREGYSGELVNEILRRYPVSPESHFILDPMCGSGSTLLAARQAGFDALGLDVNKYAVLASCVKTAFYSPHDIYVIRGYLDKLRGGVVNLSTHEYSVEKDLEKYFSAGSLRQLLSLRSWLETIDAEQKVVDLFRLALIAIVEDCSNRKKDGNGLATRPSLVSDVSSRYISQLDLMVADLSNPFNGSSPYTFAQDCSAMYLSGAVSDFKGRVKKALGAIIFSPPYANSFDYFESYKMELLFGGYETAVSLNSARDRLIRNYRITKPRAQVNKYGLVEMICAEVLARIPKKESLTGVRDGRTRLVPNMLRGYFEDMHSVISGSFSELDYNGMMHIVVDQSAYMGVPIPTDIILANIAEMVGFDVVSVISCRRANTSGQQLRSSPYLKSLLRESIISLRKPIPR